MIKDLMYKFADSKGIHRIEVDDFLSKYENPETIDDLLSIPNEMLKHYSFITDIHEPLKKFVKGIEPHRYERISLDRILDYLDDKRYFCEEVLKGAEQEEVFKEIKSIEQCIVKSKFGSVVFDW